MQMFVCNKTADTDRKDKTSLICSFEDAIGALGLESFRVPE